MNCRSIATMLFAAAATLSAAQLHAQESFYEDHPDRGLRFADMEFAMPTDPLLPSWVGVSHQIHTPAQYLSEASLQLHTAIPAGTDAAAAVAVLAKAGAHCALPTATALTCHYRDVETPWGGEYFDSVTWTVNVALSDGRVRDVAVMRDWLRR